MNKSTPLLIASVAVLGIVIGAFVEDKEWREAASDSGLRFSPSIPSESQPKELARVQTPDDLREALRQLDVKVPPTDPKKTPTR